MERFRCENLELWHLAIALADRVFETANILILWHRRKLIQQQMQDSLLDELNQLCGSMTNFKKRLFNAKYRGQSADEQKFPGPQPSALNHQRACL